MSRSRKADGPSKPSATPSALRRFLDLLPLNLVEQPREVESCGNELNRNPCELVVRIGRRGRDLDGVQLPVREKVWRAERSAVVIGTVRPEPGSSSPTVRPVVVHAAGVPELRLMRGLPRCVGELI